MTPEEIALREIVADDRNSTSRARSYRPAVRPADRQEREVADFLAALNRYPTGTRFTVGHGVDDKGNDCAFLIPHAMSTEDRLASIEEQLRDQTAMLYRLVNRDTLRDIDQAIKIANDDLEVGAE